MGAHVASDLKEMNRAAVYELLKAKGEISKAEVGRLSGISAPTVIKIVDYFREIGVASEAGALPSALGRKPVRIRFEPESSLSIGAQYDGVHLTVGLVDLGGRIHALRRSEASSNLRETVEGRLPREIKALFTESSLPWTRVHGIGIGVPAVIDRGKELIRFAPLAGLRESFNYRPILDRLGEELGFPVFIENDANAAALGEVAARGPGEGCDLVFIEMGRGLGAGLILDGRLRRGSRHSAGEIGYLALEGDRVASLDEPGWLESRMDLDSFWNEVSRWGSPSEASLTRVVDLLALALSNICVSLDIGRVVVGQAGQEPFGPLLLERLAKALSKLCVLDVVCDAPRAPEPGVTGAAGVATEAWMAKAFAG